MRNQEILPTAQISTLAKKTDTETRLTLHVFLPSLKGWLVSYSVSLSMSCFKKKKDVF